MILDSAVCHEIEAGKKTQIRRLVVGGDQRYRQRKKRGVRDSSPSMTLVKPFMPKVGDRYPIKSATAKPIICHVKVTAVRTERHGNVSDDDARREGHKTISAYKVAWVKSRDKEWIAETEPSEYVEFVARFDARWADRDVYVIDFEVDRAGALFLAADPAAMQADYVTSPSRALPGEPEVNYDTAWLNQQAKDGEANLMAHRKETAAEEAARCELLELHERLRQVGVLAARYGVDVKRDMRVIEQRVASIEADLRKRPAA